MRVGLASVRLWSIDRWERPPVYPFIITTTQMDERAVYPWEHKTGLLVSTDCKWRNDQVPKIQNRFISLRPVLTTVTPDYVREAGLADRPVRNLIDYKPESKTGNQQST